MARTLKTRPLELNLCPFECILSPTFYQLLASDIYDQDRQNAIDIYVHVAPLIPWQRPIVGELSLSRDLYTLAAWLCAGNRNQRPPTLPLLGYVIARQHRRRARTHR